MTGRSLSLAVLHGGPSSEHDVSVITAREVLAALRGAGHRVDSVYVDREGLWHFNGQSGESGQTVPTPRPLPEALTQLVAMNPACAFLGFHGTYGEAGRIQAALDLVGVAYSGSGVVASAVAMDKPLARRVLESAGIAVPPAVEVLTSQLQDPTAISTTADSLVEQLGSPTVVKVAAGGSSIGIEIPGDRDALVETLTRLRGDSAVLLCEGFVTGVELTAAVLSRSDGSLEALPVVEISPVGDRFFDYEAKYEPSLTDEIVPARITAEQESNARRIGLIAHRVLGCRAVSRTDMILDIQGRLQVLETNTLPGLTPASLLPKAAEAAGCDYVELLHRIIRPSLSNQGD